MSVTTSAPLSSTPRPVRLTMRGRAVIIFAVVTLLVVSVGWVASSANATNGNTGGATTEWVVQPGETLWQIAEEAAPNADPRETAALIIELNELSTAGVQAGQSLLIPA